MRLILASGSPRRRELLAHLGLPFEVAPPDLDEIFDSSRSPADEGIYWAVEKARAVHRRDPKAIVIGSDTVIDLDGQTIGKPLDPNDAVRILSLLAGRAHTVVTAVAVIFPGGDERVAVERTKVRMRSIPKADLVRYAGSGEPLDKAGGYSLQGDGRKLIDSIEGDYPAAVGLPLRALARILDEAGIRSPADMDKIYLDRAIMNWKSYET